jgi:molybdopterin/thiamine biosynthesis adenylyltransferase
VKTPTLAMPEHLWEALAEWLSDDREIAGVLLARVIDDDRATTILARDLRPAPPESYLDRRADGLSLRSTGWVPAVRESRDDNGMALFVHTHPRGQAFFSRCDDVVDAKLRTAFQELAGVARFASVVVAGDVSTPTIAARLWTGTEYRPMSIRVAGNSLTVSPGVRLVGELHTFDRQVRALGRAGQEVLQALMVGVVGAGGTGSPVFEQLVRLGVGSIVVIDDDVVTASTVARGYGTGVTDIGRPKVEVLRDLAERIGLGTEVEAVMGNIRDRKVVESLRHCDVVFCCADGHAARLVLNRWAYWHLAPVVDVAVLVSSLGQRVIGVDGRLTWLSPGAACLLCRERIDPTIAYAEQLDPEERRALAEQGYAPELDESQPSVVTYTTVMAGMAVTELLNRLFTLADTRATEYLLRLHEHSISMNRRLPRPHCFCSSSASYGRGMEEPYLDLTWAG